MSGAMRMGVSKYVSAGSNEMAAGGESLPKGSYFVKVKLDGKFVQTGVFKN
jgi:hypothetical protein